MKNINSIAFRDGSKEELLPNFEPNFPYISSCAELDKFIGRFAPWHWHKEVELFYIQKGVLEYYTPNGKMVFPAGSGGLVNSNVLHMTKPQDGIRDTTQVEHIFDTSLIAGQQGGLIEQKYITPFVTASRIEVFGLYPENPKQQDLLGLIVESFQLDKDEYTYEIKLRSILSEIWCQFLELSEPLRQEKASHNKSKDKIKLMMVCIHERYTEKLSTTDIAAAAFVSERECFRAFNGCLHMSPIEYLNGYRMQKACHMLVYGNDTVTRIGLACGFGSSSYFGKLFRERKGCTPHEYRKRWQDNDTIGQ